MPGLFIDHIGENPIEQNRYLQLAALFKTYEALLLNKQVLDFGACNGLSTCALIEAGASTIIGVEPDSERLRQGMRMLKELGLTTLVSSLGSKQVSTKVRHAAWALIRKALGSNYEFRPETTRLCHRALTRIWLPSSRVDPYPNLVIRKKPGIPD